MHRNNGSEHPWNLCYEKVNINKLNCLFPPFNDPPVALGCESKGDAYQWETNSCNFAGKQGET